MRNKLQQRKDSGFTIIEVLIVLAIAGLIMVVVFLAVPALQRQGRNNALNTDANNIFTGVNNYVSNNNGQLPPPAATAYDSATNTVTIGDGSANDETVKVDTAIAAVKISKTTVTPITKADDVGTVQIITGKDAKCNDSKSGITAAGGTTRSVAVLYVAESGSGRIVKCLD